LLFNYSNGADCQDNPVGAAQLLCAGGINSGEVGSVTSVLTH